MDVKAWMKRFCAAVEEGRDVDALEMAGVMLRLLLAEHQIGTVGGRDELGACYSRLLDRVAARMNGGGA